MPLLMEIDKAKWEYGEKNFNHNGSVADMED